VPRNGVLRTSPPAARVLRRVTALLLVLITAGVGWLWLRDSSLAQVDRVEVTGLSSSQRSAVEEALGRAARDMTTLHVREDALRTAVAPYESVETVTAEGDFPDTLRIHVRERRMVAVVAVGGAQTAVSADGRLLHGVEPPETLPELDGGKVVASDRLDDGQALNAVAVLAKAPPDLHPRVKRARRGDRGLVLEMRAGPDLIFGDRSRVRAKWAAAARVLAEPSAVGAVYLDLRLPERVAAGGVAPTPEPMPEATPSLSPPAAPAATPTPAPAEPPPVAPAPVAPAPAAPEGVVGTPTVP
jgi:cell division septal protein FtsQ